MSGKRRFLPRIGIVLLNLLGPGLGLLRLGKWQLAITVISCSLGTLLVIRFGPQLPFLAWLVVVILAIGSLVFSIVASWLLSASKSVSNLTWSRWPMVTLAALVTISLSVVLTDPDSVAYRNFYSPSEGMAPTLPKGDRFVAYMRAPTKIRRGDVVLVRAGDDEIYVKRVAGLPGDRIEVVGGVVVLNGRPAAQQLVDSVRIKDGPEFIASRRLQEQFPDEGKSHQIYDIGQSAGDDFAAQIVRSGHYFLLGDNRDRSADSRLGHRQSGLEQVPERDVLGKALFYSWGSSKQMGTMIQ